MPRSKSTNDNVLTVRVNDWIKDEVQKFANRVNISEAEAHRRLLQSGIVAQNDLARKQARAKLTENSNGNDDDVTPG